MQSGTVYGKWKRKRGIIAISSNTSFLMAIYELQFPIGKPVLCLQYL